MKIQKSTPITAEKAIETAKFSISSGAHMFSILSRMYSNPELSMIREIICNAIDANQEAESDRPVEVCITDNISIKDYGPGMSHDFVMKNYIQCGFSTKSDDNERIGGFGLGSKSPFTVSKQFTIVSNYEGTKRVYSCFIDEEGPRCSLIHKESTTDIGVEILVPISNYNKVVRAAELVIRFFPESVVSSYPEFRRLTIEAETDNYVKFKEKISGCLVGKIFYPLQDPVHDYCLKFSIGEVDLVPSRENLEYTDKTNAVLEDRKSSALKEIVSDLQQEVDKFDTFLEAYLFVQDQSYQFRQSLTFRGHPLNTFIKANTPIFVLHSWRSTCEKQDSISPRKDSVFYKRRAGKTAIRTSSRCYFVPENAYPDWVLGDVLQDIRDDQIIKYAERLFSLYENGVLVKSLSLKEAKAIEGGVFVHCHLKDQPLIIKDFKKIDAPVILHNRKCKAPYTIEEYLVDTFSENELWIANEAAIARHGIHHLNYKKGPRYARKANKIYKRAFSLPFNIIRKYQKRPVTQFFYSLSKRVEQLFLLSAIDRYHLMERLGKIEEKLGVKIYELH